MLELPWWIMGTAPDDGDYDGIDTSEQFTLEVQESMPSTPVSQYRTPSSTPFLESPDSIAAVDDLPTFCKGAKRRSSAVLESTDRCSPKVMKTSKKSSFERKETEIMNNADESFGFGGMHEETFALIGSELSRPVSPSDLDNSHASLADMSVLDAESSFLQSSQREFPLFFTSFNDTTVLFNTTITGDYDEKQQNEAVGEWVFKGNKYLQENKNSKAKKNSAFKEPKSKKSRGKARHADQESDIHGTGPTKKEEEKPSNSSVPSLARRQTPSRKAKTYKSMREL